MAAKLLHSLADENPDLQKQIGCMTGIFQLFDRHHIIGARRINQKMLPPPPGNSHFSDGSLGRDSNNIRYRQTADDINLNKGVSEKQRLSTESSRASFSSSCSSSLSSLDCKVQEASFDQMIFPETPSRDPIMNETTIPPQLGRQSLDLRDVVKDSMYREARGLSVNTAAKEEAIFQSMKHRDSPRPFQLSKSVDESFAVGVDKKQNVPIDIKESLRVLAKLKEAPWHYGESRDLSRSSYEVRDSHRHSVPRDAPRFSYDGREISRLSFESRDTIKCPPRLKELPRLSLDSMEGSWRTYNSDSKPHNLSRGFDSGTSTTIDKVSSQPQSSATQRRPPSVVAKLMGLESLPESHLAGDTQSSLLDGSSADNKLQFSRSSGNGLTRPLFLSSSLKGSLKDPSSPRRKNHDLVMKPISSSKFPIEPAPWKQQDGNRSSQKPIRAVKAPARTSDSFPSVYSEIEKRLKDLEFKQSGRDLRALKQILEAMQAKGLLDNRKEEQTSNGASQRDEPKGTGLQNSRTVRQRSPQCNNSLSSTVRGSDSTRAFESPIVIMKPAKLVEKTGISASSVIPIGGISSSHKLQSGGYGDNKNSLASGGVGKDQSPKHSRRDATGNSTEKKASTSKDKRSTPSQPRSQQISKENSPNSVKNSGSVSPRLQQKKLELERRSRPPTAPSDSKKSRRQSGKHATESGSPGGKLRPKSSNLQHSDDQMSEVSNESRNLSCQEDEVSQQSDSVIVSDSKIDMEVTSSLRSAETEGSQNPSMKSIEQLVSGSMQKKSIPELDEDESVAELATAAPEHPSPVSVLDGSLYRDDAPSPVKQVSNAPIADDAHESKEDENECQWNSADSLLSNRRGSGEINRQKLQSIDHLVQKLRRLNSNHDEARNDYIASLCENTNPDHRYISEILLASGLLLRDLSSKLLTFQLHSSGQPINPELFFVLEQTKASSLLPKEENSLEIFPYSKQNPEKSHRKLIFDAVNEILGAKLALVCTSPEPWSKPNRLTKKTLNAQKLLKELCFDIEKLQAARKPESGLEDEEDDGLKSILWEDVMHGSDGWTDLHRDIPGIVLDVERSLFKDLVDEVVMGEAACLRVKAGRRRKLFAK